MATNPSANYGTDLACFYDADPFFSGVTGIESVRQDAFHRVTTDDVLGPGGVGWGKDCRRLLGMHTRDLAAQQPIYSNVLLKDERIESADVTITATTNKNGLADVRFEAICVTAFGPFDLVLSILDLTTVTIEGQA